MTDLITVHWDTARKSIRQDVIPVTAPADVPDIELARECGYGARHWDYDVQRFDDGSTVVFLYKD